MCQAYEAEAAFVTRLERRKGRCDTCGKIKTFCPQYCEGNSRFERWFNSPMFNPKTAIWKERR